MRLSTVLFFATLILVGCGPHHATSPSSSTVVGDQRPDAPATPNAPRADTTPPAPDAPHGPDPSVHILTNDEMITETHKCEAAGLNAIEWGDYADTDNPKGTTEIRCAPRKHDGDGNVVKTGQ